MKKNRLAYYMNEKGISQADLAKQAKTSQMNIYNEKSEPKVGLALRIAKILGVSVVSIFTILIIYFLF